MATKKKYKNYEEAVERLEEITAQLESGEATLEDSIKLYTEGLEIATFCNKRLTDAEEKIKKIAERDGLTVEEDFDSEEEA